MLIGLARTLTIIGAGSILVTLPVPAFAAGPDEDSSSPPPRPVDIRTGDDSYLTNTTYSATLSLEGAVAAGVLDEAQAARVQDAAQRSASRDSSDGNIDSDSGGSNDDDVPSVTSTATVNSGECAPRATSRAADDPAWGGNDPTGGSLVVDICNGPETFYYVPTPAAAAAPAPPPPPAPAVLAQQAYGELTLPTPTVHRSPSEGNSDPVRGGLPFTIVGLHTWFWASDWQPVQRTVELAGVSVTLTATPTALVFDPGNGDAPVTCAGAGRPWTPADENDAPTNSGCAYVYRRVSADGPVTSTTSAQWSVSWTSNTGAGGTFPTGVSEVTQSFLVEQIQVVVR